MSKDNKKAGRQKTFMSRREFLKAAGVGLAATGLAACAPVTIQTAPS
jgi:hypothetical protein